MFGRLCIMALISLFGLVGCGGTDDPVDTVVEYPISENLAEVIQENVNRNLESNGYKGLEGEEWNTLCGNFKDSIWNFDETQNRNREGGASLRSQFAHGEVLVWIWSATDLEDRVEMTPGLLKGFCQNIAKA